MPDHADFILRFCLFAAAHSLFAARWVKRAIAGPSGREPRFYRMVYNLGSIAMFAWVMGAWRNSPVLYFAPGVWSLIMYLLQFVIASSLFCCLRQTGVADLLGFSQIRATTPSLPQLITSGCYGIVRHPLYLLASLFLVLNPVMTGRWLLLTILSVLYFVGGALIEEKRLVGQFGDEYRRYRQRVPFMIPGAGRFRQPPEA